MVPIGEGEVYALPPRSAGAAGEEALEWEGNVRCTADVAVGGLVVDDVLTIKVSRGGGIFGNSDQARIPVTELKSSFFYNRTVWY